MALITAFIEIILHLDTYLQAIIQDYGLLTYALLFIIVFLETGLVVTPFLPGDSLLFAAGTFAALQALDVMFLIPMLALAAILGDTANYKIGQYLGNKILATNSRWIKKEYIEETKAFYARHGNKTIVLARFAPIVRTFAPFLAGIGKMQYSKFLGYNIFGGILWVFIFVLGGYFFGNIPWVKENFTAVIMGIIVISFIPVFYKILQKKFFKKQAVQPQLADDED